VQAAGRPPIALAAGGALDIVRDGVTGFLVAEPTATAVGAAMQRALRNDLDPRALVASARRFDAAEFDTAIGEIVARACGDRRSERIAAAR
jgi:glycosyltransferase involved in cell wall biosynthesis